MSDEENKNKIFSIVQGGATEDIEEKTMVNAYTIITIDDDELFAEGFLMPTSQHIMVMRETDQGALPILVVPLERVKFVEIVEEDDGGSEF